ncbi:hypothetical protein HA052_11185 [Chromobacterium haemolyticum]|uniref:Ead/Ea22-like family protein n=1 Tax=Chromobacterium fluminis TaxID=3044269 RepID=A0ABX0L9U6_9NEIS|nr:ead/Ea22-like family protein [Chromobacterium haemolyticum]NHR05763.1 hypothetical protein [Chromobacterium haemolyticum]
MITKEQLAELTSLARAATPGPWENQTSNGWRRVGTTSASRGCIDGDVVANGAASPADMSFIAAANPAMVLALIAELAQAHEARREAQLAAQEAQTSRDSTVTQVRRELGQRIVSQEKDAARYRAMRDGLVSGELENNPMGEAMYELGERVCGERGHDAIPTAAEFDAAIDAVMAPPRCTCPSGGSLRWPCTRHPPESA